jgi:hypothetical protein
MLIRKLVHCLAIFAVAAFLISHEAFGSSSGMFSVM